MKIQHDRLAFSYNIHRIGYNRFILMICSFKEQYVNPYFSDIFIFYIVFFLTPSLKSLTLSKLPSLYLARSVASCFSEHVCNSNVCFASAIASKKISIHKINQIWKALPFLQEISWSPVRH